MSDEMKSALELIASSCLDAVGGRQRFDAMEKGLELVSKNPELLAEIASPVECRSIPASRRMIKIYTKAMETTIVDKDDNTTQSKSTTNIRGVLSERLCTVWKQNRLLGDTTTSTVSINSLCLEYQEELWNLATPASLTLGFLGSSSDDRRVKWIDRFVETMLFGSTTTNNTKDTIVVCQDLISKITLSEWETTIGPMVEQKCKASPEKFLETVKLLLSYLSIDIVGADNNNFVPFLLKQLKLSKTRPVACDILQILGVNEIRNATNDESCCSGKIVVATSLVETGIPSLLQADQRRLVYETLIHIGRNYCSAAASSSSKKISSSIDDDLQKVLKGLTTAVMKEKKAAESVRETGIQALTWWMVVAIRRRQQGAAASTLPDTTLSLFRKSMESGIDFLPCVGTIVTSLMLSSSHQMNMNENNNEDIMESILLLLVQLSSDGGSNNNTIEQGLQSIFEKASTSKKAVAHTEGLLALYVSVLHVSSMSSSSSTTTQQLAMGMEKICKSSKSFLYHSFELEGKQQQQPTPPLVQYLLPRLIALFCKYWTKKKKDDETTTTTAASSLFVQSSNDTNKDDNQQPKLKPTSIARTMAQSLVHCSNYCQTSNLDILIQTYDNSSSLSVLITEMLRSINRTCCTIEEYRTTKRRTTEESLSYYPDNTNVQQIIIPANKKHIRSLGWKLSSSSFCCDDATAIATTWIFEHYGTTTRRTNKRQRRQLCKYTKLELSSLNEQLLPDIANVLSRIACGSSMDDDGFVGQELHEAALSVLTTLGMVAGAAMDDDNDSSSDIARQLTTKWIPLQLQTHLEQTRQRVEELSDYQIHLWSQTRMGTLYNIEDDDETKTNHPETSSKSKVKVNKGRLTEEDEWELQLKKELEAKNKKNSSSSTSVYTPEQVQQIREQDTERTKLNRLLTKLYPQSFAAVRVLCCSDIEIGNACLSVLGPTVLTATLYFDHNMNTVSPSLLPYSRLIPLLRETLEVLASCVYELDEEFAPDLCQVLLLSCCCRATTESSSSPTNKSCTQQQQQQFSTSSGGGWTIRALPSSSASVEKVMTELLEYGDVLSFESFGFCLPLICSVLTGPRTPFPESAEIALVLLQRHTTTDDDYLLVFRREMASAILEFLKHDRSSTTSQKALETLVSCYTSSVDNDNNDAASNNNNINIISTSSLAPLMDYAIHPGKQCRLGCMMALTALAESGAIVKKNPLVENRVWVNCFAQDEDEEVRVQARKAWQALTTTTTSDDDDKLQPPSILYAIPLLPLLSNNEPTIAKAAAAANAYAMMSLHNTSSSSSSNMMERNVTKLCTTYLENYPTEVDTTTASSSDTTTGTPTLPAALASSSSKTTTTVPPPKKKKMSTASLTAGLRKPARKKTDALSLIGGPKTGVSKKKSTKKLKPVNKALLKPKEERTLDQLDDNDLLFVNQFKTNTNEMMKQQQVKYLDQLDDNDLFVNQFKTNNEMKQQQVIIIVKDSPDKIRIRQGMLDAIAALTTELKELDLKILKLIITFLIAYGLADTCETVRSKARTVIRQVVTSFGSSDDAISFLLPTLEHVLHKFDKLSRPLEVPDDAISFLLPTLEHVLHNGMISSSENDNNTVVFESSTVSTSSAALNRRKEGAVVALGSVALHLKKGEENNSKIDSTVDMLLATLLQANNDEAGGNEESVQSSVADCLVKLMKKGNTPQRLEKPILEDLMRYCLHGEFYGQRRGSAHGIAAAMKGSGIASLKKYNVVAQLQEAASDVTGSTHSKEGSIFAMELLSVRLGLLFEPYVIVLLPSLLQCFSDNSDRVRAAAAHTADVIMSKLSAHGVKLVLPAILGAFVDPAWRTKEASIQMLGSMSHLAPKQLAGALPRVVPKLTEAFSDTHPRVKASAEHALGEITKVVRNPEISSISSTLLLALTDPSEGTLPALEALIQTEFLHAMDAPSLALIVPVLHRGLRDRIATTKRYAALIAGNICSMIHDPKDFVPYLPLLLPDLQLALLDPIPDVRSTAAKALGSLSRGLGAGSSSKTTTTTDLVDNLRPWLIEKLRQENITSAERSGAAQGLTEVLLSSSTTVEKILLEELLPLKSHPSASTREGVLWVLTFLPSALTGANFTTALLESTLPALLNGLSDESEPVRDVAMRAGRVLIRTHGKANVDTILPRLELGLVSDDYRIRLASLTLLGDLLSLIGGTSVQATTTTPQEMGSTQDEFRKAERAQAQLALELGPEIRKSVLSSLYLARSDTEAVVRQTAVQVWKTVVAVTARALRDILPSVTAQILTALASGHLEQTQVAGRCLGDIVQKLGDGILPDLLPLLQKAILEDEADDAATTTTRRGVCVGLQEVISHASSEAISNYLELLTRVVRDALCDSEESVRDMAASCFQSLHQVVGQPALDEMVPSLLIDLESPLEEKSERANRGLAGILKLRSRELLPYIIPRLLSTKPITISHANALTGIAEVTGATLHAHFHTIIPAVITSLSMMLDGDEEHETALRQCARSIANNTEDVNDLISQIASKCGNDKAEIRNESCWMFQTMVEERKDRTDFYEQLPVILRELLYRLNDESPVVLKANRAAWSALTKHVPAEELVNHIEYMQNLLASMVSEARRRKGGVGDGEFLMPGFNIPKGLDPLLPVYQRGILYGTPVIREVSASGLGECISLTASKFLAGPLIIKMTGPLLRIVGDRNPSNVKVAILRTLGLILVKGGPALRAFVPQFQTTFVKALQDQSRQVRLESIAALGLLMPLSTRVDPLLKELVAGSLGRSGEQIAAVQMATLEALAVVLSKGGGKAKQPDSVPSALSASQELVFEHADEGVREAAAKVMGAACAILGEETTTDVLNRILDASGDYDDSNADIRHGKACACHRVLASSVSSKVNEEISDSLHQQIVDLVITYTKDDKASVKESACVALGAAVGSSIDPESCLRRVETVFINIMQSSQERMEIHKAVASGLCVALKLYASDNKVLFFGKNLLDASLRLAMSGTQRVQYAFNDVLWLALGCGNEDGGEGGLESYLQQASFDNSKAMKSVHSKVLSRIQT
eukprot:CAMPEP_0194261726 /NCGR_PEP_ID=MMETSP0158-20130606/46175_1 /TAXON_ID=33649 /ORGANISM="Thalassionema nitzschioides, Strain L26-B" /LENGTH=3020 /DNA_ID=CAMNT_0039001857 /DNA_START=53 /DNA_END=9111 /DNA_ORIENTATION=-